MSGRPSLPFWTGIGAAALCAASPAGAAEPELTSDTSAQFYEVRSPTGEQVIARRRLTTTLGVAVYDLLDDSVDPNAPSLTFRARMRYDADYGGSTAETEVTNYGRVVPGFSRGPVDLMYGYVEGRKFLDGWFGFRLGRQYVTDALGWWSFDGGTARLTTPGYVTAEIYGGLEQRGGMPLSSSRYERDGVWRGDRTGYDRNLWPAFQSNDIAPAFGVALESAGVTWLHSRATYRRVYNTGTSNVSEFASGLRTPASYDGSRVSQERIGYAVDATLASAGGLKAGFAYDLYGARMGNIFATADAFVSSRVTVSADYDYYVPTFDADSIWNFFLAMPMNDLGLRASWDATDRLSLSAGARGRLFEVQTGPESTTFPSSPNLPSANYYPSSSFQAMGGGNVAARYRTGDSTLGARGAADVADNGQRLGMDVYGERTLETRYVLSARTGVWQWKDDLRADRDATSFGYVAGAGYKVIPRSLVRVEWEHDINRLVGQRYRVMLWLTLAVSK
jgi:hypothetical protein